MLGLTLKTATLLEVRSEEIGTDYKKVALVDRGLRALEDVMGFWRPRGHGQWRSNRGKGHPKGDRGRGGREGGRGFAVKVFRQGEGGRRGQGRGRVGLCVGVGVCVRAEVRRGEEEGKGEGGGVCVCVGDVLCPGFSSPIPSPDTQGWRFLGPSKQL